MARRGVKSENGAEGLKGGIEIVRSVPASATAVACTFASESFKPLEDAGIVFFRKTWVRPAPTTAQFFNR